MMIKEDGQKRENIRIFRHTKWVDMKSLGCESFRRIEEPMRYSRNSYRLRLYSLCFLAAFLSLESVVVSQEQSSGFVKSLLPEEKQLIDNLPEVERTVVRLRLNSASRDKWWWAGSLRSADWKSWEAGSIGSLELGTCLPITIAEGSEPLDDEELREMAAMRKLKDAADKNREEEKAEAKRAAMQKDAEIRTFGTTEERLKHEVALKGVDFLRGGGLPSRLPEAQRELTYALLKEWENAKVWQGESGGEILMRATLRQMEFEGKTLEERNKVSIGPAREDFDAVPLTSFSLVRLSEQNAALWTGEEWFLIEGDLSKVLSIDGIQKYSAEFFHSDHMIMQFVGFKEILTQSGPHTVPSLKILETSRSDNIAKAVLARNGYYVWSRRQICNSEEQPCYPYTFLFEYSKASRHTVASLVRKSQKFVYGVTPQGEKSRITVELLIDTHQEWLKNQ
jgi:hypothetical protein